MDWIEALTLAVLQGLTEFLPVSSSGHLAVVQQAFDASFGRSSSGKENLFFVVMLHVGTLVSVLAYYRTEGLRGVRGLLGSEAVEPVYRRASILKAVVLGVIATLPAVVVALLLGDWIESAFVSLRVPATCFLITAMILLWTTRLRDGGKTLETTTWLDALLIGCAQAFAILPGVSRSGSTIAAALALGFSRTWAVGFSLLMSVLAIAGATVKELKDADPSLLTPDRLSVTLLAAIVSGLVGYGAIVWLVRIVRSGRLWYFSVYLILLSITIFAGLAVSGAGGGSDAGQSLDLDRTARGGLDGSSPVLGAGPDPWPVDRSFETGPGPVDEGAGPNAPGSDRGDGLVLGRPLAGRPRPE